MLGGSRGARPYRSRYVFGGALGEAEATPGTDTVSVSDPGIVPFERVFDAIRRIGCDGYLTVEAPTLHKDADRIARDNLFAIREGTNVAKSPGLAL